MRGGPWAWAGARGGNRFKFEFYICVICNCVQSRPSCNHVHVHEIEIEIVALALELESRSGTVKSLSLRRSRCCGLAAHAESSSRTLNARVRECNTMPIIYGLVARGTTILCDYATTQVRRAIGARSRACEHACFSHGFARTMAEHQTAFASHVHSSCVCGALRV